MAVIVKTNNPSELLSALNKAIDNREIETWLVDNDGDFTHSPDQWKLKAWMRPKIYEGELRFGLLGPKDTVMTKLIYGVYHGRFTEMLLTHFDVKITSINCTSFKTEPDNFATSGT